MPDIKATLERIQGELKAEERECQWYAAHFASSPFVYISKQGLKRIALLLAQGVSEASMLTDNLAASTKWLTDLEAAKVEIEDVLKDNEALRRDAQAHVVGHKIDETRIEMLTAWLTKLRSVFNGNVVTNEEMKRILDSVDEVLKP